MGALTSAPNGFGNLADVGGLRLRLVGQLTEYLLTSGVCEAVLSAGLEERPCQARTCSRRMR